MDLTLVRDSVHIGLKLTVQLSLTTACVIKIAVTPLRGPKDALIHLPICTGSVSLDLTTVSSELLRTTLTVRITTFA